MPVAILARCELVLTAKLPDEVTLVIKPMRGRDCGKRPAARREFLTGQPHPQTPQKLLWRHVQLPTKHPLKGPHRSAGNLRERGVRDWFCEVRSHVDEHLAKRYVLATVRHHGRINDPRDANRAHDASAAVAQWLLRRLRPSGRPVEAADEFDAAVHGLAPQYALVVESILVSEMGGGEVVIGAAHHIIKSLDRVVEEKPPIDPAIAAFAILDPALDTVHDIEKPGDGRSH